MFMGLKKLGGLEGLPVIEKKKKTVIAQTSKNIADIF